MSFISNLYCDSCWLRVKLNTLLWYIIAILAIGWAFVLTLGLERRTSLHARGIWRLVTYLQCQSVEKVWGSNPSVGNWGEGLPTNSAKAWKRFGVQIPLSTLDLHTSYFKLTFLYKDAVESRTLTFVYKRNIGKSFLSVQDFDISARTRLKKRD